jgi:hypothetical protein
VLLLLHKQKDLYFFKAYTSFEIVACFRSLGATVTGQNLFKVEIKSRFNLVNACYHSVQNIVSCHLLSKNIKIRIYKAVIFHLVLYECETWSLTLSEEHRLKIFENRVLRRIFGPKRACMAQQVKICPNYYSYHSLGHYWQGDCHCLKSGGI